MANISLISQPASADNERQVAVVISESGWSSPKMKSLLQRESETEASLFRGIPRGKSAAVITVKLTGPCVI